MNNTNCIDFQILGLLANPEVVTLVMLRAGRASASALAASTLFSGTINSRTVFFTAEGKIS